MKDPNKEKFIIESIERIRQLKNEIKEAKKNHKDIKDLMEDVKREISSIQKEADEIFDSKSIETPELSQEELEAYLQNPSNFSKEDWELLESMKNETASCKKEIIKAGEGEAVKDILGKKRKHKTKRQPKRA